MTLSTRKRIHYFIPRSSFHMSAAIITELSAHFHARHLYPTAAWLQALASTTRPNTTLPGLIKTARFRLLASDFTQTLAPPPNTLFPQDVLTGASQCRYLTGPIICQVLDIEDIGHSKWSQVESIEAKERGEATKGREIVRVVPGEDQQGTPTVDSKGPFKVLLQDAKGVKVYGLDLIGIEGLNMDIQMGLKLILRNCELRRGVLILIPGCVHILGGQIAALDKAWKDSRKSRLMEAVKAGAEGNDGS